MLRTTFTLLALTGLSGCFIQANQDDGQTSIDEPFDTVVVDVETGSVDIRTAEDGQAELGWDMRWGVGGCPEVDFEVHEGVLWVKGRCAAGGWGCSTDFVLEVPAGVNVDARVTTGQLLVEDAGEVLAELTTGDIEIGGAHDTVELQVTTGTITAMDLRVDTAWAEVTTGSIELEVEDGFELIDAEVITGEVRLDVPSGCYDLDLGVITGNIDTYGVDCGCDADASIRAQVITGSIDILGS